MINITEVDLKLIQMIEDRKKQLYEQISKECACLQNSVNDWWAEMGKKYSFNPSESHAVTIIDGNAYIKKVVKGVVKEKVKEATSQPQKEVKEVVTETTSQPQEEVKEVVKPSN